MTTGTDGHMLSSILQLADTTVVGCEPDGTVSLWNPAAERLLGYTSAEAIGMHVREILMDPAQAHRLAEGSDTETVVVRKDGSTTDVLLRAYPVRDEHGQTVSFWAVLHDITHLKQRERAAAANARRLAQAQEMAHVGSFEVDMVTQERWWSDEFWRILGLEPSSGTPSRDLHLAAVHPEDLALVQQQWRSLDRSEEAPEIEYRIARPSGDVRWVRTRAHVVASRFTGHPVIVGTTMDITDKREAFERRFRAERNFEAAFARSPIGMAIAGIDGVWHQVNPAFCAITGRTAAELVDQPAAAVLHPGGVENPDRHAQAALRRQVQDFEIERRLVRPDGSAVWVHEIASLLRDEGGSPSFYFVWLQDISDRRRHEAALTHQAFHDQLTGLPNREMLTRRLEASLAVARRTGDRLAVLFIDVDQFKVINDSLGHRAGDVLLVLLAQRLGRVVRSSDLLARFGGDELVMVCDRMDEEAARLLADRIAEVTREPFVLEGREVFVTVSVGITMASGNEDQTAVLRSSDSAMYQAKKAGPGRSAVYTEDIHERATVRLTTASHLGRALERGEFALAYRPIMRLADEQPIGFEALLRWNDPERGLIPPLDFIPVAEETGMIIPIGEWVLQEALGQINTWRTTLPGWERLAINLNVSGVQLRDHGFVDVVHDAVAAVGVDPASVHLELTESIIMEDIAEAADQLQRLRAVGAQLAIDDFGTGYSSLAYLSKLPATSMKIDRSFVRSLDDGDTRSAAILRAIVGVAQAAGLSTVAEGIETESQKMRLTSLGAELGQGFLWARPLPPVDVPAWLAQFRL
jgi:diguanylate cyclase (GGDEF)-like protein/PAS domain S-box-containing protein